MKKTIYLATDHAGFDVKQHLKTFLMEREYTVIDCGAYSSNSQDDYPDFISKAAAKVSKDPENSLAIIFGGSGQGEAMVANRFKNVRATVYYGGNEQILTLSREHNNANILSLGARFITNEEAQKIVETWIGKKFSGEERHKRRIRKIEKYSKKIF